MIVESKNENSNARAGNFWHVVIALYCVSSKRRFLCFFFCVGGSIILQSIQYCFFVSTVRPVI